MRQRATRTLAIGVLVAALVVAGLSVKTDVRSTRHEVDVSEAISIRDGVTIISGVPPALPALIEAVRARVPRDAGIRVITTSGVCVPTIHSPGVYYWFVYEILPRVSTCDTNARWWVWLRVRPSASAPMPRGARAQMFAPDLVLAEVAR